MSVIDSLEFARTGQTLCGSLPIAGLSRLQDSLFDALGKVEFAMRGGHDPRRRPVLTLDISGVLHLQCQRCLGALDYPLRLANTLLLVSQAEAAAGALDDESVEWIEAGTELDVAGLIEDEILLSLPYAPRHEEGRCGRDPGARKERAGPSPFAGLAALKKDLH